MLVRKLEEAICSGVAPDVLVVRMLLDQHFTAKHKGCAVRYEGIPVAREAWVVEAQQGNKATIRSLADEQSRELLGPRKMCEAFQRHFAQLFGRSGE